MKLVLGFVEIKLDLCELEVRLPLMIQSVQELHIVHPKYIPRDLRGFQTPEKLIRTYLATIQKYLHFAGVSTYSSLELYILLTFSCNSGKAPLCHTRNSDC